VLVADDDADIRDLVAFKLEQAGFEVIAVEDGQTALDQARSRQPTLAVLDVSMPGLSGIDVCRMLRSDPATAGMLIIMLTARVQEQDVEGGFSAGADDYVTKPFGVEELLARIRAATRRAASADDGAATVAIGDYTIDLAAKRVDPRPGSTADDVRLTPTEWRLLETFVRHPGKLIGQRALIAEVWGPTNTADSSNLRLYLNRLRRKLEPDPSRPRHLITEPGMGYRFQP